MSIERRLSRRRRTASVSRCPASGTTNPLRNLSSRPGITVASLPVMVLCVGAAVPARLRGVLSGLLQQGYATGNLLAAVAFFFLFQRWGWRPLFFLGGLPALLALFVRFRVKESEVWE